jgi:hypothetical protein
VRGNLAADLGAVVQWEGWNGREEWKSIKLILCKHATGWYRAVLHP